MTNAKTITLSTEQSLSLVKKCEKSAVKHSSIYKKSLFVMLGITVFMVILSFFRPVCDWYTDTVYILLNETISRFNGMFKYAVGEFVMYLGAITLLTTAVVTIIFIFLHKNITFKRFAIKLYKADLFAVVFILTLFAVNWLLPFRSSILKVNASEETNYSIDEVLSVRNYLVEQLNEAALSVQRDEDGRIIYYDVTDEVIDAMQAQSYRYGRLSGYYSPIKPALCSDVLEWMGIGGFNYAYSIEPTYNVYCDNLFIPVLFAHEYAHHKGYYRENEAEFLSSIALAECSDPLLQYSAYIQMYNYLDSAYYDALCSELDPTTASEADYMKINEKYSAQPQPIAQVYEDQCLAWAESDELYEENVNEFLEDNFEEVSTEVAETGWQVQGEVLKENTYDGVVLMYLRYFVNK